MAHGDGLLRLLHLLVADDCYAVLLLSAVDDTTVAGEEPDHLVDGAGEGEATHSEDAMRKNGVGSWEGHGREEEAVNDKERRM